MKNLVLYLSLLFLLASCDTSHEKEKSLTERQQTSYERNQRQLIEAIDNITAKLNLPNLKKGVDSFEIRIWCPISACEQRIITIRYIYSQWHISETDVWESYPDREFKRNDTINHLTEVIIDSTKSRVTTLKTDKEKFVDTLLNKFVLHFPKRADLEGTFQIGMDSYRYIFEIAEKNNYQLLAYNCGGSIVDKPNIHKNLREFLNFLRRQIDDKIPDCN